MSKKFFILPLLLLLLSIVIYRLLFNSVIPEPIQTNFSSQSVSDIKDPNKFEYNVSIGDTKTIEISESAILGQESLPDFITFNENKLTISPLKKDFGSHAIVFFENSDTNKTLKYNINVLSKPFDEEALNLQLESYLGEDLNHYGIYIKNLMGDGELAINGVKTFPSASISKIPPIILALRDIDYGKRSFEELITVKENLKHSSEDSIGRMPHGNQVSLKYIIELMLIESNNSAHYHLRDHLGGTGVVNERIINELGVNPFFEDPLIANASNVGIVYEKLYKGELLLPETKEFFINTLGSAVEFLREGIPGGVPKDSGVSVINKVGFLFGNKEGDTYSDSGIVFGKNTDYVIVILNDKTDPFPAGSKKIAEISRIVYRFMDERL